MPNVPAQFPHIDLPGAEFFSLSQNATIALQGRRRKQFSPSTPGTGTPIPPNANATIIGSLILEDPFPATAGIYIHYLTVIWSPQDATGHLTIVQTSVGFSNSRPPPGFVQFNVGIPTATGATPIGTQNILVERELLLTSADISLSAGGNAPINGELALQAAITAANNDTVAHNVAIFVQCIYTRLDGLTE